MVSISRIFIYVIFFGIPLDNLISRILFISYFFIPLVVWLNYSIVLYEVIILEYYADWWMGWAHCSMGRSLGAIGEWAGNSVPLTNGPHC